MKGFAAFLLAFVALAHGQNLVYTTSGWEPSKTIVVTRTFEIPDHFYVIEFAYDRYGPVSKPAVEFLLGGASGDLTGAPPHYPAEITVYEISGGNKHLVGQQVHG